MAWRKTVLNDNMGAADVSSDSLSQDMLSAIKEIKSTYYSEKGTIDYVAIRGSREYSEYKKLSALLREYDPLMLRDDMERLAFWINLYNTIIVDGIIALDVKGSVKEVTGFFSRIGYKIGRHFFSSDDLEHGILRRNSRGPFRLLRQFRSSDPRVRYMVERLDPRIHFALVCGSRSCAPIKFYSPDGIYDELELAASNFINSPDVIVIPEDGRVAVSMLFRWYQRDFGGRQGVLEFIERYTLDDDKKEFLRKKRDGISLEYLPYDWSLNS